MTKAALRRQFLAQRQTLSTEDITCGSNRITSQIFEKIPFGTATVTFHTFLPIVRRKEVDTWPIIHRIWRDFPAVRTAVSVTDTTSNQLAHYLLTPETPLVENRWSIPEPQPEHCAAIGSKRIDLVLVPLLVFDKQGHRVGYGKGYYDRFLSECRSDCLKIGLSLFEPVDRIADVEPTDVRLDSCITPEQTYFF